jgi:hypothetical protein
MVGSARAGAWRGSGGRGSRVAEATRAASTAVVSPKATSPSLQGHRDAGRSRGRDAGWRGRDADRCRGGGVGRCRGRDLRRCRGRGVGMVCSVPVRRPSRPNTAYWYDRCLVVSCYAVGRLRPGQRVRQLVGDHRAEPRWSLPSHAANVNARRHGRLAPPGSSRDCRFAPPRTAGGLAGFGRTTRQVRMRVTPTLTAACTVAVWAAPPYQDDGVRVIPRPRSGTRLMTPSSPPAGGAGSRRGCLELDAPSWTAMGKVAMRPYGSAAQNWATLGG